jgi:hypothetical protein
MHVVAPSQQQPSLPKCAWVVRLSPLPTTTLRSRYCTKRHYLPLAPRHYSPKAPVSLPSNYLVTGNPMQRYVTYISNPKCQHSHHPCTVPCNEQSSLPPVSTVWHPSLSYELNICLTQSPAGPGLSRTTTLWASATLAIGYSGEGGATAHFRSS